MIDIPFTQKRSSACKRGKNAANERIDEKSGDERFKMDRVCNFKIFIECASHQWYESYRTQNRFGKWPETIRVGILRIVIVHKFHEPIAWLIAGDLLHICFMALQTINIVR